MNKLQVIKATDMALVDVIQTSHEAEEIECFDISSVSKDIVSYSSLITKNTQGKIREKHTLAVHGLSDLTYLNGYDKKVTKVLKDLKNG